MGSQPVRGARDGAGEGGSQASADRTPERKDPQWSAERRGVPIARDAQAPGQGVCSRHSHGAMGASQAPGISRRFAPLAGRERRVTSSPSIRKSEGKTSKASRAPRESGTAPRRSIVNSMVRLLTQRRPLRISTNEPNFAERTQASPRSGRTIWQRQREQSS
jgi:hypothetical protein